MKNIILWIGIPLGLLVGLYSLSEGNTGGGLFWIAIAGCCAYMIWKRKHKK